MERGGDRPSGGCPARPQLHRPGRGPLPAPGPGVQLLQGRSESYRVYLQLYNLVGQQELHVIWLVPGWEAPRSYIWRGAVSTLII